MELARSSARRVRHGASVSGCGVFRARRLGLADVFPRDAERATVEVTLAAVVCWMGTFEHCCFRRRSAEEHGTPKIAAREDVATLVSKIWHFPTVSVERCHLGISGVPG